MKFKYDYNVNPTTLTILGSDQKAVVLEIPRQINGHPVTEIGWYAFDARNIREVSAPSVRTIGLGAFSNCFSLEWVVAPEVERIEMDAFCACSKLDMSIPDTVKFIGTGAFYECGIQHLRLPDGIAEMERSAFERCEHLSTVYIPASLRIVQEGVFRECLLLTYAELGEGVREIKKYAFQGCRSLQRIDIPKSVEHISPEAFLECDALRICGESGSYVQSFAEERGIPFDPV